MYDTHKILFTINHQQFKPNKINLKLELKNFDRLLPITKMKVTYCRNKGLPSNLKGLFKLEATA